VARKPGLKVAYVALWLPEPSQTFVLDEVNTLYELGLDLEIFTLYGPRSPRRLAGLPLVKPPVTRFGSRSVPQLLKNLAQVETQFSSEAGDFFIKSLRRWPNVETVAEAVWSVLAGITLAKILRARGFQHIHASWANGPATAAWTASRLSGIPFSFCARAHDIYPPDGFLREKLTHAAFIRSDNKINKPYLSDLAPAAAPKIHCIYNGVPLVVNQNHRPAIVPPFKLLALGRLVAKKGFTVLLESCRLLDQKGLNFQLVLAGDGPERVHLQQLVERYRLGSRVKMPGFVDRRQVSRLLAEAHLFVMPSIIVPSGDRDGIPTVVAEALLYQVPVVATSVTAIPEMVRPGETGWLEPPGDPEALARAITEALADPAEAQRRAANGARLMREEFDSRKNYRRLMECFEKSSACR
jgi:colanic acid/amylovoran biosynthesis glycosyltransferase